MRAWPALLLCACAPSPRGAREATPAEFQAARTVLEKIRASEPSRPYVAQLTVTIREPRSGRTMDGRGALAVDPRRAMRMILVGPGGATALDAWVTPSAWRFAVPAIDLVKRGGADAAAGLPIAFFRWWMLAPLRGEVRAARVERGEDAFVLRDGDAAIELFARASGLRAARRVDGIPADRVEWTGASLSPRPGDRAIYVQGATGLRVEVRVESLNDEPPDPEAFVEPREEGT